MFFLIKWSVEGSRKGGGGRGKMQSWKSRKRQRKTLAKFVSFPSAFLLGVKIPKMAFAIILLLSFCRTIRQGVTACNRRGSGKGSEREGVRVVALLQGVKRVKELTECCQKSVYELPSL